MSSVSASDIQRAVRWYPPSYDIRVEEITVPKFADFILNITVNQHSAIVFRIEHPDDAIVKVKVCNLQFLLETIK